MKKNERYTLTCERLGSELEGVCFQEGIPVFVPEILPGETATVQIVKTMERYAYGKLISVEKPSEQRREPFCSAYEKCGGCSGQHMCYEATLEAKRQQIYDCLKRIGHLPIQLEEIPPVLGAASPLRSRNKTAIPVGGTSREPVLGFYRKRSHDPVDIEDCPVSMPALRSVANSVREWIRLSGAQPYQETTGRGWLRHVVIRENRAGEAMVLLCATSGKVPCQEELVRILQKNVSGFHSLHLSVNRSKGNVILGPASVKLWGKDEFCESLLGLKFHIAPLSFFQVNPNQTEVLYQKALEFCELKTNDLVVDAYAGAGTISLCMARRCGHVIGIEIVPQAVESAVLNAQMNGITNAEFHTAAVEELLPKLVADGLRPDVIVLDPPRKGVEQPVIDAVVEAGPNRVVYVSCNPATLARDLQRFYEAGYHMDKCQGVDMFCYASGVENVAVLSKLNDAKHIDIHVDMSELDATKAETDEGATYEEIKAYVKEHSGLKVSALYIAQVKRKYGIIERACYNKPKTEDAHQSQCPANKEQAIVEALKSFGMISD